MMLTNCCVLFTGYAWSHVMCSAGAISALLFPLVCALCLHSQCHFFLCSYVEMACTVCFSAYTHSHKHTCRCWQAQVTTTSHSLHHDSPADAFSLSTMKILLDLFGDGKLLELFQCEDTRSVFHACYVVYHGDHSTMQHILFWSVNQYSGISSQGQFLDLTETKAW